MKNFFSKDNFQILADRKLLVAIAAVIFVPILYAGMFLWAFWDPYEHLVDIPVAVVNEDEAYNFEGERLAIGDELIENLKDNREFDFQFVDKSKGYQGLHDQDYYILIEIPEDFSKNAATVLDDTPQQLDLIYKPNESFNFLAAQMGETAMLQIEQALEEEITATYAETIFDKIDEVADGLADASEATDELNDGANELKDGSKTLEDNLITFSGKTVELKDGVNTAYDGSADLADGANVLSSGINELYDNSNKLKSASEDLQNGTNQLSSGITEANDGLGKMQDNIPQLISGTNQVKGGLDQLYNELPKEMSKEIGNGLNTAANGAFDLIDNKIDDVQIEIEKELADLGLNNIENLSEIISDKVINEVDKLPDVVAKDIITVIKEQIGNKEATDALNNNIMAILDEEDVSTETKTSIQKEINNQTIDIDFDNLETVIANSIHGIMDQTNYQEKIHTVVDTNVGPIEKELKNKQLAVNKKIDEDLKTYKNVANEKINEATKDLNNEIKSALNEPIGELQSGLTAINEGQETLQDGVNQLANGTNELQAGSNQLASGQNDYVANMTKFTSSFATANDGTQDLVNGTNSLYNGMFELKDGSLQLNDASHKLADGSSEIYKGMNTLTEGTDEFNKEMHDAADEAGDINATSKTNDMIANPVNVENEKINEVPNYGTGFAPYFLSLGLFVGVLLLSIVYPLTEPSNVPSSGFNWFLRKFLGLFSIGVLQAIIAGTILILGLGLEVQSVPLFFLFAILTSLVFITLIQFLVTCFGDPGRFVAILILILQLTTSAGTFPLELIPKFLQPFNLLLPMTYSVAGFKAVISSGDFGVMWSNAGILLTFSIVSMLLTLSYFMIMHKRKFGSQIEAEETTK